MQSLKLVQSQGAFECGFNRADGLIATFWSQSIRGRKGPCVTQLLLNSNQKLGHKLVLGHVTGGWWEQTASTAGRPDTECPFTLGIQHCYKCLVLLVVFAHFKKKKVKKEQHFV